MGATTIEEYRKYIEKDIALARRFQAINVPEPTQEVAIAILKGTGRRCYCDIAILISSVS